MKLSDIRPTVETTGQMVNQLFSIEDTGAIFDILRNRMYSDPIRAICREITSNARDAHREVGKEDVECEITLPSAFDKFYKVKDFGPGISPERMATVFIRYTASTKRDDNKQTGGFGLGAKTPFSYSDTFTIVTIVDNIKYHYACFIDPTKVGQLSLLRTEGTSESNGTEIIIPVKSEDFNKFAIDTEFVTRHWDVKPILHGRHVQYKSIVSTLEGSGYKICKSNDYNTIREIKLVIDGIEYPLELSQLKGKVHSGIFNAINGTIYLYFGVGELDLSATRESVHLSAPTEAKINDRLSEIVKDFKVSVLQKIDGCVSLWDANVYLNNELGKTFNDHSFLGALTWKGLPLIEGSLRATDGKVFTFSKGLSKRGRIDPDKIVRTMQNTINFVSDAQVYFCDLAIKEPQIKDVKKAFENDKSLKHVYVIVPNDDCKDVKAVFTPYSYQDLEVKNLSGITKVSRTYSISGVRLLVFKYDYTSRAFRQVAYSAMEEDTGKKVICSLDKIGYNSTRTVILKNKKSLDGDIVKSLILANPGYSIYGVDSVVPTKKVEEHFSDFLPIDDFVENFFAKKSIDFVKIKYAMKFQYSLDRHVDQLEKIKSDVKDPDSIFLNYIKLNSEIATLIKDHAGILNIYETIKNTITEIDVDDYITAHPEFDYKCAKDKIATTYPLLSHIDYYTTSRNCDPIIHYINLIDKDLKN